MFIRILIGCEVFNCLCVHTAVGVHTCRYFHTPKHIQTSARTHIHIQTAMSCCGGKCGTAPPEVQPPSHSRYPRPPPRPPWTHRCGSAPRLPRRTSSRPATPRHARPTMKTSPTPAPTWQRATFHLVSERNFRLVSERTFRLVSERSDSGAGPG